MIATLILKSLATGYIVVAIIGLFITNGRIDSALILPFIFWWGSLIISVFALLVFRAIEEHK